MSRPLWWRWSNGNKVHGPFTAIGDIATDAHSSALATWPVGAGILVGTAPRPHWNTAIFARVDELFDAANPMPDLGDYPPSCAWTPAQLGELCAELEGVLTAWLGRHGHGHTSAPDAAEIDWHVAFTWEEIMRLAGAIEPAAEQPEYRPWPRTIPVSWSWPHSARQGLNPEGKFALLFRDEVMPLLRAGDTQAAIVAIESHISTRDRRQVERAYRLSPKAGAL